MAFEDYGLPIPEKKKNDEDVFRLEEMGEVAAKTIKTLDSELSGLLEMVPTKAYVKVEVNLRTEDERFFGDDKIRDGKLTVYYEMVRKR